MSRPQAPCPRWLVDQLIRYFGGVPQDEADIIHFIGVRYGARTLSHLPEKAAKEALRRPEDFLTAARKSRNEPF